MKAARCELFPICVRLFAIHTRDPEPRKTLLRKRRLAMRRKILWPIQRASRRALLGLWRYETAGPSFAAQRNQPRQAILMQQYEAKWIAVTVN